MSIPQSSQCARVLNRRLRPQCDAVWIPESALSAVLEHYCSISRVACRNGSSLPGPMENRRRLGKRHMGELNFGQTHSSAPIWELCNAVDLSKWQWQPPTKPSTRLASRTAAGKQGLWETVLDWLASGTNSQDKESQPNNGVAHTPSLDLGNPSMVSVAKEASLASARSMPERKLDIENGVARVIEDGLDALLRDASLDVTLAEPTHFLSFCNSLEGLFARGQFVDRAVCVIIEGLADGLTRFVPELHRASNQEVDLAAELAVKLKLEMYVAALNGVSTFEASDASAFNHLLRSTLLRSTAALGLNNLRIFRRIVVSIPNEHINSLAPEILVNLDAFFLALGQHRKRHGSLIRQVNKMAGILQKFSPNKHAAIFEGAARRLIKLDAPPNPHARLMRFSWLQVLARLPEVNYDFLKDTILQVEKDWESGSFTTGEICQIFVARLNNRGLLQDVGRVYQNLRWALESQVYTRLTSVLWKTGQANQIKHLCQFLHSLRRDQDIVQVLRVLRRIVKHEASPLANLAVGLGHPELALNIQLWYRRDNTITKSFWDSATAKHSLKALTSTKTLASQKLLHALRVFHKKPRSHAIRSKRLHEELIKTKKAAIAFAQAPYISNRTALARLEHCVKFYQSHQVAVPPQVLRSLLWIITRDLEAGRPGRTSRLRWFMSLLLKEAGPATTLKVGLALKKWRAAVFTRLKNQR